VVTLLYHDLTANFLIVLSPLLHHPLGIASHHTFAPHPHTLFLTRLKTHLFAESLLWHCYAVVFSLYFWHPRALEVGRHSKFMLIDWLKLVSFISCQHTLGLQPPRPPSTENCRHYHTHLLLWPWPWPNDLHIKTRPLSPLDVRADRKWTLYVEAFKSYHITDRQTDMHVHAGNDQLTTHTVILTTTSVFLPENQLKWQEIWCAHKV